MVRISNSRFVFTMFILTSEYISIGRGSILINTLLEVQTYMHIRFGLIATILLRTIYSLLRHCTFIIQISST